MVMKTLRQIVCVLVVGFGLAACEVRPVHPADKGALDSVLVTAHIRYHGQYYPNIDCNVLSVDMLSRGLEFDSLYHISGSGVNLYLSDVFVPLGDTVLTSGIYTVDTTAAAYTMVPAADFGPGLTGAYLLRIDNSAVRDTLLFTRGEMTVTQWADSLMLQFEMYDGQQHKYRATCVTRYGKD